MQLKSLRVAIISSLLSLGLLVGCDQLGLKLVRVIINTHPLTVEKLTA
jgi:hypothetical protein